MLRLFKNKEDNSLFKISYDMSSGIPFRWEYEIKNNKVCEFVKSVSKGEKTKEPICGGNVETTYYFRGLKKGKTSIIFRCVNFADDYVSSIDEYKIVVDDKLNISLVSKKAVNIK